MFTLSYAIKSILRRKKKNVITAIAIALGVSLFIGTQAGSEGLLDTISQIEINSLGNEDVSILDPTSTLNYRLFSNHIVDVIKSHNELNDLISALSVRVTIGTSIYSIETGFVDSQVSISGIEPSQAGFGDFIDLKGNIINLQSALQSQSVIIPDELANRMDLSEGDFISFSIQNGYTNISSTLLYTVSAIYDETKDRGLVRNDGSTSQIYTSLSGIQNKFDENLSSYISEIYISVKGVDRSLAKYDIIGKTFPGKENIQSLIQELENILSENKINLQILSNRISNVETQYDEYAGIISPLEIFTFMLNGIALLLIINVQTMSIEDRKYQTAILRALGSNRWTILTIFLIESAIIGIIGAILGFILGYFVSLWVLISLGNIFEVQLNASELSSSLFLNGLIIGILLAVLTSLLPSYAATNDSIASTLRGAKPQGKPRGNVITFLLATIGFVLVILGILSAMQIGDLSDDQTWISFENQTSILLGFGLTLVGFGLILTLILPRRQALSLSGATMLIFGFAFLRIFLKKAERGNPGPIFTIILLFLMLGSTLIIVQNYDYLFVGIRKILSQFETIRAIVQVTTSQMVGKKSRGILVYSILSIILILTIMIAAIVETQKDATIQRYDELSDGVDIVVTTDNNFNGTRERILSLQTRFPSSPDIVQVFAFRRTLLPVYVLSPEDVNFDINKHLFWLPIVELSEEMINPNGNWGDDSLKFDFETQTKDFEKENRVTLSPKTSEQDQHKVREFILTRFLEDYRREENIKYQTPIGSSQVLENQAMIIGGNALDYINPIEFATGQGLYIQGIDGSIVSMFIGATTMFDMLGFSQFPLFGNAILVSPTFADALPFDVEFENVFLIRSSNTYNQDSSNVELANLIESDLNNLNNASSFSSTQLNNLIGAYCDIIKEVVVDFWKFNNRIWAFMNTFGAMGLFIGTMGMMIIAIRSVTERYREIGMMRAIGFSRTSIIEGVMIEMIILVVLSSIAGTFFAVQYADSVIGLFLGVDPVYPYLQISLYIIGLLFLALISAIVPSYNASKIAPSHALRYTG